MEQVEFMRSGKTGGGSYPLLKLAAPLLLLLAMLAVGGCASLGKSRGSANGQHPPAGAKNSPVVTARGAPSSVAKIVNDQIQHGHYAEGEAALRQHLAQHPDDAAAGAVLRQLTVDPAQMLGSEARDYTVRSGDSYSSLALHYLGDASLFLVLARYNGSNNPSNLRVGQTVRLPVSRSGAGVILPSPSPPSESAVAPVEATTDPLSKAQRLQRESVVLMQQGKKREALAHLEKALLIEPTLASSGSVADSLRKQLVVNYHERAVVLYRDQKLDPAIALWDRALAIDPGYEPAVTYRARALELKRRLKQF